MRIAGYGSLAASLIFTAITSGTAAQTHDHGPTRLGSVTFKVDCNAAAQQDFHRGVAYLHSFAFRSKRWPRPIRPAAWPIGAAP